MAREGPTLIQSVQRALHLLEALADRGGRASVKQLAHDLGLAVPTAHHLVRTLSHEGYLVRHDDGTVTAGRRLTTLAADVQPGSQTGNLRRHLRHLRDEVGTAVCLARYVDGELLVVELVDGPPSFRLDLWVGLHDAAHATALGKAVLSVLSTGERRDYLSRHRCEALTPHTCTDARALEEMVTHSGAVSTDNEEYALGVRCLAAPITTPGWVGSVAIAAPPSQLNAETAALRSTQLRRTAQAIERTLTLEGVG